jgi:hypothetical protein
VNQNQARNVGVIATHGLMQDASIQQFATIIARMLKMHCQDNVVSFSRNVNANIAMRINSLHKIPCMPKIRWSQILKLFSLMNKYTTTI